MILIRYLLTTLTEILISLSGFPSGPVALFTLSDLTILFISSLKAWQNVFFYGCNAGMNLRNSIAYDHNFWYHFVIDDISRRFLHFFF